MRPRPDAAPARGSSIKVIADDGMPMGGEMNSDLVRATRFRMKPQLGDARKSHERLVLRDGFLSVRSHRHLAPVLSVSSQGIRPDPSRWPRMAPCDGTVGLSHSPILESRCQDPMRARVSGEEHDARRSQIESMDQQEWAEHVTFGS